MNLNDPLMIAIVNLMESSATVEECKVIRGIMDLPDEQGELPHKWYLNRMQRNPDNCKRNFLMWIEEHYENIKHGWDIRYKYQ